MAGKGDRPRSVYKDKYDVKHNLAFSKTNPYTDDELNSFIEKGWITEKEKGIFKGRDLDEEVGLY